MGYQLAILAVFITFALLEAKSGKLFKKATEVSDDGKVELIGTLLLFIVTQPLVLFCSATMMAISSTSGNTCRLPYSCAHSATFNFR